MAIFELANPLPHGVVPTLLREEDSEMFARFIAALTVMLALSAPAWAADRKDLQVARDVSKQVLTYPQFSVFDAVHMQIDNDVVTLTGKVTMPYKRNDLEKRVAKIDGVHQVINKITVLPVTLDGVVNSNTDRMLARSIASSFGAFSVTNDLKTDAEAQQELEHL